MTSQPRSTINRNLILLLPKPPALDWIVSVDTSPSGHLTLDRLRQEQDAFLVLEGKVQTVEEAQRWIERRWSEHFIEFLDSWFTDEGLWPKRRTRAMFREWFDVQFHSMVWDMSDDPITHEQWD